jgi:hypothetical protein
MGVATLEPPWRDHEVSEYKFESGNPFKRFVDFVRFTSRHVLDDANRRFLEAVVKTSESRKIQMKAGTQLWRAQLGSEPLEGGKDSFPFPLPFKPERMKPKADRAKEGRVNPKGIPCLYLSHDKATAMKEVRPSIGAYLSVSQFTVNRDLVLVNCIYHGWPEIKLVEGEPDLETFAWWAINSTFSEPATRSDETADYAPTQIIAEAFRLDGADGIAFGRRSHLNIALFDLMRADAGEVHLYRVDDMTLKFSDYTAK